MVGNIPCAVFGGVSWCPASEGSAWKGLSPGCRVPSKEANPGWGWAKSRQRPGCALGENPNLSFPEAETANARACLVPIKGTLCVVPGGGEAASITPPAPRHSLGTGVTASEPQLSGTITPVTPDLLEPTWGQTVSRQSCSGQVCSPCLGAGIVGARPDTFLLGKPSG